MALNNKNSFDTETDPEPRRKLGSYLSGAAVHTYRHFGVYMEKWHKRGKLGPWPGTAPKCGCRRRSRS